MLDEKIEKILMKVQKPGRYTGGEVNSVVKDLKNINIRFAFCFPDIYEVGMSHIGMKIIYGLLNRENDIWCERVFAPWTDMENVMLENNIKLYGLESGDPITEFDFIGFTLQYELSYTNILNMLKLADIPLKSKDRKGFGQFVVAGGPCACNPEPLADFIDIFFIGEGEDLLIEAMNMYRDCKSKGYSREAFLYEISHLEGVYVPRFYDIIYNDDGTIKEIKTKRDVPLKIKKRIVHDVNKAYYPNDFVVPSIGTVHDRAVCEIFRGCTRGCRFCQAGFIYRPVREKSPEVINEQGKALCYNTGYDEISLSSLSSSDYSGLKELFKTMKTWTDDNMVSISLPSLRVDGFSDELTSELKNIRRSGLTFAPEAGTQRLRDVINKNVTEEELISTCKTAFSGGWTSIKLYFMIGLPTETKEDIEGIACLGQKVVDTYYKNPEKPKGKPVKVTLSTASFVPKPFTPFQWEPQDKIDVLLEKQSHLRQSVKSKKINLNWHGAETSFIEAIFARGDRKLCTVLEKAHLNGIKFDGWDEYFSLEKWLSVFKECGIDPGFYANRKREFNEIFPWDHIDIGISKKFLQKENEKSKKSETTPGCMEKCTGCGAAKFKEGICIERCTNMV